MVRWPDGGRRETCAGVPQPPGDAPCVHVRSRRLRSRGTVRAARGGRGRREGCARRPRGLPRARRRDRRRGRLRYETPLLRPRQGGRGARRPPADARGPGRRRPLHAIAVVPHAARRGARDAGAPTRRAPGALCAVAGQPGGGPAGAPAAPRGAEPGAVRSCDASPASVTAREACARPQALSSPSLRRQVGEAAVGSAVKSAMHALSPNGGRVVCFLGSPPTLGVGKVCAARHSGGRVPRSAPAPPAERDACCMLHAA